MTLCNPSLVLFIIALFFFTKPTRTQTVTFKTVQDCVNYEYDKVLENLCTNSNQCNVNLCSPEYKSTDSYDAVVVQCENVMQTSPSVVEPLMQARCKRGSSKNDSSNMERIGTIVGGIVGGLVGLVVLGSVGAIVWHKFVRELPLLTRMGMAGSSRKTTRPIRKSNVGRDVGGFQHGTRSRSVFAPPPIGPSRHNLPFSSFAPSARNADGQEHRFGTNMAQALSVSQTDHVDSPYSPVTEHSSAPPTPSTLTPLIRYPPSLTSSHPLDTALEYTPTRARYNWV